MNSSKTGITYHLNGETQQQDASRQRVGASFGIHLENIPRLTGEVAPTGIDNILISTNPIFLNGVQSGRSEFIALSFEKHEIVAQDAENTLQWAMYNTLRPALWRYGYVCGWNEEFYKYAMQKQEEQVNAPKLAHDERRER